MDSKGRTSERSVALFLLGLLVFYPPLMTIFTVEKFLAGVPILYIYIFLAWSVLVALVAMTARLHRGNGGEDAAGDLGEPM